MLNDLFSDKYKNEELISFKDLLILLNITPRTLYTYINKGKFPKADVKLSGMYWKIGSLRAFFNVGNDNNKNCKNEPV